MTRPCKVHSVLNPTFNHLTLPGCDAVAHVASDLTFGPDPDVVIPPVVDGVQQVLASAAATPSIKRFVLTSSSCSAVIPRPNEHYHVDASTWNDAVVPLAYDAASPADKRGFYVYSASKTLAERALWKFMDAEPRGFSANAVLPNFTTGPMIYEGQSGSTGGMTLGMYKHDDQMNAILQGFMPQWQNDVENVAMVHFAALTMGDVEKERLVVFENPFNYNDLLRVMKKINPEEKYPEPIKDLGEDISTVDNKRALELLQRLGKERFRTFEESITANCLGHY